MANKSNITQQRAKKTAIPSSKGTKNGQKPEQKPKVKPKAKKPTTPKPSSKAKKPPKGGQWGEIPPTGNTRPKKDQKPTGSTKPPTNNHNEPQEPNLGGRPEVYTPELADRICAEIATSQKSLRTICKMKGMPSVMTILRWLREDKDGFCSQYARAKEEQAEMMVEDMLDISEHTNEDHTAFTGANVVQRDRLRIDTRKWIASKLKPKKYGEKLDVETTNKHIVVGYEPLNEA